ncbi:Ubiquitin fusion degradation protein, partial [Musa troglodytarum]
PSDQSNSPVGPVSDSVSVYLNPCNTRPCPPLYSLDYFVAKSSSSFESPRVLRRSSRGYLKSKLLGSKQNVIMPPSALDRLVQDAQTEAKDEQKFTPFTGTGRSQSLYWASAIPHPFPMSHPLPAPIKLPAPASPSRPRARTERRTLWLGDLLRTNP